MNAAPSGVQQTSLFTYRTEVKPSLGERQATVLAELRQRDNMTNSELAVALGWGINRVTPRTNELRNTGAVLCINPICPNPKHLGQFDVVGEECRRQCRVTGRRCIAWKIKS